ncbi:DUF2066 domain-containing protein [Alkalilimnicola ehrlichii]|uniref:DUF2066 domain-containing protein n=1 Tax=Alkalilimnicola ehrlichii TaxID=351052 RepID=A0A3E0X0R2_9GAMM|nr:DUF2066 domain-containing protein [Alkalilimnicola ehrlichii]RFA37983.1 hypothetical protein CAL65_06350 [Alkalilimnicola ehrlichii]
MHKPLAFLFGLILCVSSAAVGAAPRDEGFQVRVPVANQSSGEREEAVREAFKLLLVRLSGQRGIVEEESVAEILERSSRYVQRFRYDTTDAGLQLNVHFDSATVTQALERYEIPVWRNDRPPVLIWLAVDGGSDRMLVGAHEHGAVRLPLAGAARELGVSLLFPLLDLEDLAEVGFSDVWGGFTDNIRQASTRYGNPIVVVGRVHQQRGHWVGRWQILNRSSGAAWHSDGRDLDQSLQAAVETLAQRLVPEYTAVPRRLSVADTLLVEIQGYRGCGSIERWSITSVSRAACKTFSCKPCAATRRLSACRWMGTLIVCCRLCVATGACRRCTSQIRARWTTYWSAHPQSWQICWMTKSSASGGKATASV